MDQIRIDRPDWEMVVYKVTGTNPETNRRKSKVVFVLGEDKEKAKEKSGLIDIFSVERCQPEPPSERQINYGNDLGIPYSSSYSKRDYSCLISYAANEDTYIPIDKEAARFAEENGIYLSQFASMTMLYQNYYVNLSLKEAIAFFAFSIYQYFRGFICYDYRKHPKLVLFEKFADENIDNNDFTRSLLKYEDISQFIPNYGKIRKNTNAYKICFEFLEKNEIEAFCQEPAVIINREVEESEKNSTNLSEPAEVPQTNLCDSETEKPSGEKTVEKEKHSALIGGIVICAIAVVIGIIIFACCANSGSRPNDLQASSPSSEATAAMATGNGGLSTSFVESYFYKNVSDLSYTHGMIVKDGSYSLDFSLSDDKSEQEDNYDDFALSVKNACNAFEKTYEAKARIFSIWFFKDDNSHIYWLSTDGGENGTLYEKNGNYYSNETSMSFDELLKHYAAKN